MVQDVTHRMLKNTVLIYYTEYFLWLKFDSTIFFFVELVVKSILRNNIIHLPFKVNDMLLDDSEGRSL